MRSDATTTSDGATASTAATRPRDQDVRPRNFDARTRDGHCNLQIGSPTNESCTSRSMRHAQPPSDLVNGSLVWVLVRGDTFRANRTDIQWAIAASTRRHVLVPLRQRFPFAQLHVHLCVRMQQVRERNPWYLQQLTSFPGVTGSLREFQPDSNLTRLQADLWLRCMDDVPASASFALVLRSDLYFTAPVNVSVLHSSRFFFQWNLWHDCATLEMADQLQGIGGRLLPRLRHVGRRDRSAVNACWWATLHYLYNFLMVEFGSAALGYLNFFPDELCKPADGAPITSRCLLRGNPLSSSRDHAWYRYDRDLVANGSCSVCAASVRQYRW